MTRLSRVLRFVFAIGVRGAANPFVAVELLLVVVLSVSLLWPTPDPVRRDVVFICRRTDVLCGDLLAEAQQAEVER